MPGEIGKQVQLWLRGARPMPRLLVVRSGTRGAQLAFQQLLLEDEHDRCVCDRGEAPVVRCCRRCQGRSHTLGHRQRMAVKVDGEPPAWLEAGDYANCGYDLFLSKVGKDARHNAGVA
mgnify:CR=1 FL=1